MCQRTLIKLYLFDFEERVYQESRVPFISSN